MTSRKPIIISDTKSTTIKPSTKSKKLHNTKSITSTPKKSLDQNQNANMVE